MKTERMKNETKLNENALIIARGGILECSELNSQRNIKKLFIRNQYINAVCYKQHLIKTQ